MSAKDSNKDNPQQSIALSSEGEQRLVERVVSQLNALSRTATVAFALSIGECLVQNVHQGDLDRFRSRDRNKRETLRSIAVDASVRRVSGSQCAAWINPRDW